MEEEGFYFVAEEKLFERDVAFAGLGPEGVVREVGVAQVELDLLANAWEKDVILFGPGVDPMGEAVCVSELAAESAKLALDVH